MQTKQSLSHKRNFNSYFEKLCKKTKVGVFEYTVYTRSDRHDGKKNAVHR